MKYQEIEGDLIKLALEGNFDVIVHGVNCQNVMKSGLAPKMAKAFGCDTYELETTKYKGDINKLGQIDYGDYKITGDDGHNRYIQIVNAYTQYNYGKNHRDGTDKPLDYEALTLCLRKINHIFKGKHIGLPLIGCGLAGGVWDSGSLSPDEYDDYLQYPGDYQFVKHTIQRELKECQITIVKYKSK